MVRINRDIFISEENIQRVLSNVTKFCSLCYKEFNQSEELFLNSNSYEYICKECACKLSQELDNKTDMTIENIDNSNISLF